MNHSDQLTEDQEIFTVSELNASAREVLEESFPNIWVEGEVSNFLHHTSGHMYFSLKDDGAQVRCAFFRGRNRFIDFDPEDGTQVLVRAGVSLYEGRGDYQLIIEYMEQAGDGALRRAFDKLKNKLEKKGLFDLKHKKALPLLPKAIGVITSPTGAAIRDILSVLKRRFPAILVIIYPSQVQGEVASQQLINAINIANRRKECDVLLLSRGGGSLEDLWPFNDEQLAHCIFQSDIPIVTGVGHEVDFTIADFVADHRAPTPSAAAELISPNQREWLDNFNAIYRRLNLLVKQFIKENKQELKALSKSLRHPGQIIREQMQTLDYLQQRLLQIMEQKLSQCRMSLTHSMRTLDIMSPLSTLDRGYAIVKEKDSGQIIRVAKDCKQGDRIIASVSKGSLQCVVEQILE